MSLLLFTRSRAIWAEGMHAWPPGQPPLMGNSAPMYSFFLPADGRGQMIRRRTMRDARRNIACPRAARLSRGALLHVTRMVQGELSWSRLAPVLQRSRAGQRLFYVRILQLKCKWTQHVSGCLSRVEFCFAGGYYLLLIACVFATRVNDLSGV